VARFTDLSLYRRKIKPMEILWGPEPVWTLWIREKNLMSLLGIDGPFLCRPCSRRTTNTGHDWQEYGEKQLWRRSNILNVLYGRFIRRTANIWRYTRILLLEVRLTTWKGDLEKFKDSSATPHNLWKQNAFTRASQPCFSRAKSIQFNSPYFLFLYPF
jgi:hypothetical protein